jgi:glucoamylase
MEPGTDAHENAASSAFDSWIAEQTQRSIAAMELAISATHLIRRRPEFGQAIVPSLGSVLASVSIGDWKPEPDYFFHWLRDSAIVMRTVADLMRDAATPAERARWRKHFEDFVDFSVRLQCLDGSVERERGYRHRTEPEFRKFLRGERDLMTLKGDRLLGEPRFNPDGSVDIMRWSRPQYDGPALRALACLRFLAAGGPSSAALAQLLDTDLDFTRRHAGRRCIGPWEEQAARHYYVALVQLGALVHGRSRTGHAAESAKAEKRLSALLDRHWSQANRIFVAALPAAQAQRDDLLDASFLLAVLDADLPSGPHSAEDPRVQKTQTAIEDMFARTLPLNATRFAGRAPALGRYRSDGYFGGGAWYPTTLAAAALYYVRARRSDADRAALIRRGDEFMATVRDLTPPDGSLSEQADRASGRPTSARDLTWSYAAFVNAARLRRRALAA